MSIPKVTIAIPTYNRGKYLPEAVESALNQDYPELEVIVSDNASTDNTLEIIEKYKKNPRFFFYRTEDNQGARGNWEKLLYKYSTGDWFMVLGSDDYLLDPAYVTKCMAIASEDKEIILCHGNLRFLYELENRQEDTVKNCPRITAGGWYFWDINKAVQVHIANALFKRDEAIKLNALREDYVGGDAVLLGKLLLTGKVGFTPSVGVAYRIHGENDTYKASLDRIFDHFQCYDQVYDFALGLHPDKKNELRQWKKKWRQTFFKGYYYNLAKTNKLKALRFLWRGLVTHPLLMLGIYSRPQNFGALLLSLAVSNKTFAKLQARHTKKELNNGLS